jgi:preprotein translocase subunit SecD
MRHLLSAVCLLVCTLLISGVANATPDNEGTKKGAEAKKVKVLFALKEVHPENEAVLKKIKAGEPVPPGYSVYPQDLISDETGEKVGVQKIVLKRKTIVGSEHVADAMVDPGRPGIVLVSLNKKGGERLEKATSKMQHRKSRMAIVFEDRCLIAPTVNSVLTQRFEISGLNGPGEAKKVAQILNAPTKK